MQISTTRFGTIAVDVDDLVHFPHGLIGFEESRHWVLLADPANTAVGWLQSADRPSTALAVVSPRRFVRITESAWGRPSWPRWHWKKKIEYMPCAWSVARTAAA